MIVRCWDVPGIDSRVQSSLHSLSPTFRDVDPTGTDRRRQRWRQLKRADPERKQTVTQAGLKVGIWRWRKGMHQERDSRGGRPVLPLSLVGLGLEL
jgi:hypothetical protein